ncbi:MAG: hypothetical protein HOV80_10510 [Polyangiaceae bacterium]|nr:hypothetical protein [Polyangiaceae bacterium]
MTRRAWLLNLDAEDEVFRRQTYPGPFASLAARPELVGRLWSLVPEGDVLVIDDRTRADGLEGRAWCPTPRAITALMRAGARPPPAPPIDVLAEALSRAICVRAGLTLDAALFTLEAQTAVTRLAEPVDGGRWLVRRSWGFAGRGRLVVPFGAQTPQVLAFLARAAREGGLLIEPWLERTMDCGLHGFLHPDGTLVEGEPCLSEVNDGGVWLGSRRAGSDDLRAAERQALTVSLRQAASVLRELGWFGPFGVDGFRYRRDGEERFNPRCEINARYSMGWAVGMGDRRPDLEPHTGG